MTTFLHSEIVRGALSGLVAAATVDLHAFLGWKSVQEAATYNWSTAIFRWAQGAVTGALAAAGVGLIA